MSAEKKSVHVRLDADQHKQLSVGGTNDADNLVTACESCNLGKGAISLRTFIEQLGVHEVMSAMEIAQTTRYVNDSKRFRYFCGICWKKIRGE